MVISDRAKWQGLVEDRLAEVYGAKPIGPDVPALLDEAWAAKKSAVQTVDLFGSRFGLVPLPSWLKGAENRSEGGS